MTERKRRVVWKAVALRDVERLTARLEEEASATAGKIIEKVIARAESLATLSHRGRTPPELRTVADQTWLEVIESPWRILYEVVGSQVVLHAVLDGRRDLRELLLERMLT